MFDPIKNDNHELHELYERWIWNEGFLGCRIMILSDRTASESKSKKQIPRSNNRLEDCHSVERSFNDKFVTKIIEMRGIESSMTNRIE